MQCYKAGNNFADGAVIVFDLFEAIDKDIGVSEGPRKAVIVMARDTKKFATTGGWGYEVFDPKTSNGMLDAGCHGCHTQVKDSGFLFSMLRD